MTTNEEWDEWFTNVPIPDRQICKWIVSVNLHLHMQFNFLLYISLKTATPENHLPAVHLTQIYVAIDWINKKPDLQNFRSQNHSKQIFRHLKWLVLRFIPNFRSVWAWSTVRAHDFSYGSHSNIQMQSIPRAWGKIPEVVYVKPITDNHRLRKVVCKWQCVYPWIFIYDTWISLKTVTSENYRSRIR